MECVGICFDSSMLEPLSEAFASMGYSVVKTCPAELLDLTISPASSTGDEVTDPPV